MIEEGIRYNVRVLVLYTQTPNETFTVSVLARNRNLAVQKAMTIVRNDPAVRDITLIQVRPHNQCN